jgi:GPH family glycoside/pentoside/hexuronide:cation symporter
MFVGTVSSFFLMGLMFTPVKSESQLMLFIYLTFLYCLLNTAYTLVNIPYAALLPELTDDYHQRTILTGYRMSFAVLGTFTGAGAVMPIVNLFTSQKTGWTIMGYFMGAVMMLSMLTTIWTIREPDHPRPTKHISFLKTYREAVGNRVFLTALIPWAFFITGTTMVQGALVYYFTYVFGNEALFQTALIFLLACSLLFIPIWVKISGKIGKKRCYMIGMGIMSGSVVIFALFGQALGERVSVLIMALAGIGLSTHYVMPHSILPDVVEYDSISHGGIRREGVFSSIWTFSSKIGQALALAINGWVLALLSYTPNVEQSASAIIGIKIITGPIPVLWYIAGIIILNFFPIDQDFYNRMLDRGRTDE